MKVNMGRRIKIIFCILLILILLPIDFNTYAAREGGTAKDVEITFDARGGTLNTSSKTVTQGSPYGTLPKVTRKNYIFLGWYTYAFAGAKVTKEKNVKITVPHTLYAHWMGKSFELALDGNGGKADKEKVTVYFGTKYKNQLPGSARENYVFDGWYTKAKNGDKVTAGSIYDNTALKKLYAHWKEKEMKITFVAYNGDSYEKKVTCGKEYGELPTPEREGLTFGGWYTWDKYTEWEAEPVTKDTKVTESDPVMLFARWY